MKHIEYNELNAKQKEIYNFQKVAALMADYGFNCIKLADDWQGADFLAYHIDGVTTMRVQLKGRFTTDKKYLDKKLHITFPVKGIWYLVEHDLLVHLVSKHSNWLETDSWVSKGAYSSVAPNQQLLSSIEKYQLKLR
jgi:hypothetical protein